MRRSKGHSDSIIQTGKLSVNLDANTVEVDKQPLHLTGKEYGIYSGTLQSFFFADPKRFRWSRHDRRRGRHRGQRLVRSLQSYGANISHTDMGCDGDGREQAA